MIFQWKPQTIRFMRDACENGSYNAALADRICAHLPEGAHVCDAGCGIGCLSIELSKRCARVSAADISAEALEVLRENILLKNIYNISVVEGDIWACPPPRPYDAMVFCLFGGTREALLIAKAQCSGKVILIRKNWKTHRFSLSGKPAGENGTLTCTEKELNDTGVRYKSEKFSLEMGQPFRLLDDATEFFRIYGRDADTNSITKENIEARLVRGPSDEFPYYFPALNELGMIVLETGDIPADMEEIKTGREK